MGGDLEERASELFYNAARETWKEKEGFGKVVAPNDSFTAVRYIEVPVGAQLGLAANSDGVGTKPEIAQRLGKFDTLGFDLVAMVCEDAARLGAHPIMITNTLEVNRIDIDKMGELALGLTNAAKEAAVPVINGEIAVHGKRVGGYGTFRFSWSASCVWLARKERIVDGSKAKPGDAIIAIRESGFRSNGLTLARDIMRRKFGKEWHEAQRDIALGMLSPSRLYTNYLLSLTGGVSLEPTAEVSGMAHITGGGIFKKLARAIKPSGHGAYLYELFDPPNAMQEMIVIGRVGMRNAYSTWNMGNGFMIVTPQPEQVIKQAARFGLEARIAGEITKEPTIRIETYNGHKISKKIAQC